MQIYFATKLLNEHSRTVRTSNSNSSFESRKWNRTVRNNREYLQAFAVPRPCTRYNRVSDIMCLSSQCNHFFNPYFVRCSILISLSIRVNECLSPPYHTPPLGDHGGTTCDEWTSMNVKKIKLNEMKQKSICTTEWLKLSVTVRTCGKEESKWLQKTQP